MRGKVYFLTKLDFFFYRALTGLSNRLYRNETEEKYDWVFCITCMSDPLLCSKENLCPNSNTRSLKLKNIDHSMKNSLIFTL